MHPYLSNGIVEALVVLPKCRKRKGVDLVNIIAEAEATIEPRSNHREDSRTYYERKGLLGIFVEVAVRVYYKFPFLSLKHAVINLDDSEIDGTKLFGILSKLLLPPYDHGFEDEETSNTANLITPFSGTVSRRKITLTFTIPLPNSHGSDFWHFGQ